jgi:hypothetical protein
MLIGKEGNLLQERLSGQSEDPANYRNEYGPRADPWHEDVLPRLRELGGAEIVDQTGFSRSAVYAVLAGSKPTVVNRRRYEVIASRGRSE